MKASVFSATCTTRVKAPIISSTEADQTIFVFKKAFVMAFEIVSVFKIVFVYMATRLF